MPCFFWKKSEVDRKKAAFSFVMGGDSHCGKVKSVNEDSYCFCNPPGASAAFALVGDGIGGHKDGDIASNFMAKLFLFRFREFLRSRKEKRDMDPGKFLVDCALESNRIMAEVNHSAGCLHPMGTTLVACLFSGKKFYTVHAGDSRIYLFRKGKLIPLTRDHSIVQGLIDKGKLKEEDAAFHPMAHVITRAVGPREYLDPARSAGELKAGDLFLLCSDGLLRHVKEKRLAGILRTKELTPSQMAHKLVMEALYGGGADNITALCVRVEKLPGNKFLRFF